MQLASWDKSQSFRADKERSTREEGMRRERGRDRRDVQGEMLQLVQDEECSA